MDPGAESHTDSERLRADYRGAFKDWALQVSRLRGLIPSDVNGLAVKDAEDRVEAAELVYRNSRNRLADDMDLSGEQH